MRKHALRKRGLNPLGSFFPGRDVCLDSAEKSVNLRFLRGLRTYGSLQVLKTKPYSEQQCAEIEVRASYSQACFPNTIHARSMRPQKYYARPLIWSVYARHAANPRNNAKRCHSHGLSRLPLGWAQVALHLRSSTGEYHTSMHLPFEAQVWPESDALLWGPVFMRPSL